MGYLVSGLLEMQSCKLLVICMFIATNQQAADINTLAVSPSITAWLHCEVADVCGALRSSYSPNEVHVLNNLHICTKVHVPGYVEPSRSYANVHTITQSLCTHTIYRSKGTG